MWTARGEGGLTKSPRKSTRGEGGLMVLSTWTKYIGFFFKFFDVTRGSYFFDGRKNVIYDKY